MAGAAMRECSYEVYVSVFGAVRDGVSVGDAHIFSRVSRLVAGRTGVAALVSTLAVIEARRGEAQRRKADVCNDVLCDRGCGERPEGSSRAATLARD